MMTRILQISDPHIVNDAAIQPDTSAALERLVAHLCSVRDQIGPVDGVLISGDLSDDGSPESYARLKRLMAPLDLPLHVVPGNHDLRDPLRHAFSDRLPAGGTLNWDRRLGGVHVIGLDTLVEGHDHGTLAPETLAFLHGALARAEGAPILLALHHPPFAMGLPSIDAIGLTNAGDLMQAIADYPSELRILCGHIHVMMMQKVAGRVALSAPPPFATFDKAQCSDAVAERVLHVKGCLLHRWDGGFHTTHIGVNKDETTDGLA